MAKINLPHDAFVFVGDGRKALFLRNEGDEKFLNLKTEQVLVDQHPPTREQGSDQPGRAFATPPVRTYPSANRALSAAYAAATSPSATGHGARRNQWYTSRSGLGGALTTRTSYG